MPLDPPITNSDVADRFEGDLFAKFRPDYVDTLIGDAEALIAGKPAVGPVAARRLAEGTLTRRQYVMVVCRMVLRVIRNPDGYTVQSVGDSTLTVSVRVASGELVVTDDDIADLLSPPPGAMMAGTVGVGVDAGWAPAGPRRRLGAAAARW